jgi:hypothetical protein
MDPNELAPKPKRDYHLHEWTSGQRGGGKVPADFGWRTNPKQWQEENGTALAAAKGTPKDGAP